MIHERTKTPMLELRALVNAVPSVNAVPLLHHVESPPSQYDCRPLLGVKQLRPCG